MADEDKAKIDAASTAAIQAANAPSQGAAPQMAAYDQYAQQALGGSPTEAMQKAQEASAQQAQRASDQAIQQSIKAGKTAGAMGGQAALAATGQAANAYGQAQQAGQQQYFNTAQLGAQLGSEMSGRLQNTAANVLNKYGTDVGERSSKYSSDIGLQQAQIADRTARRGQNIGLLGAGIGAVGGLASLFSDKNLKEDVKPDNLTDGLSAIRSFSYRYKNGPAYAGGKQEAGIMAQDLEKTAMSPAVVDTPEGKKVDTARLSTMNTGAIADQQRSIEKILDYLKTMKKPEAKK